MNDNSGFGGAVGLLVLLIAFGAMSNGNGGGLFGGGNNNIPAQTSAMVEQNRSAAQIAANGAALSNLLERTGGIAEATVRGFDNVGNQVRDLDSKLCQVTNNIAMGQRDIIQSQRDCCCTTERAIDRNSDRVLAWLNADRDRQQQERICKLESEAANYKQSEDLKAYIDAKLGCCKPACGSGQVENGILFQMLSQMQSLAASVAAIAAKPATTTATT